jgi:predicted porin
MKKSLIALAALATVATAAQAQSSVTLYGVIDLGIATVNNVASATADNSTTTAGGAASGATGKRSTAMQNGGSGTSRWGVRGTDDLGGGLKANFVLESEFLADDGSTKSSAEALFNRASWVGLSSNSLGSIQLGRMNAFSYAEGAKFDPFGGNNFGGYIAVGQYGYVRLENTVQYTSPKFSGFGFGFQTGTKTSSVDSPYYNGASASTTGEIADQFAGHRNTAFLATYDNGPLELSASYGRQNSATTLTDNVTTVFARYTLGSAKLIAGYMYQKPDASSGTTKTSTFLGVNYAVTPNLTAKVMAGEYETKTTSSTKKPQVYTAGLNYAFSKRTELYGIVSQSNQDNGSSVAISSTSKFSYVDANGNLIGGLTPLADKNQTGVMIGLRHNF